MKKNKFRIVSFISVLALLCTCMPISADSDSCVYILKTDAGLVNKINSADSADLIPVTIWITDIDDNGIEEQARKNVQYLKASLSNKSIVMDAVGSSDLLCSNDSVESLDDTNLYIQVKRKIFADKYYLANSAAAAQLLNANGLMNESVASTSLTWVSQYSPILKMKLTKAQIMEVAKSDIVEYIYLDDYVDLIEEPTLQTRSANNSDTPANIWQGTTNITYMRDTLGYTGSGVKVGLYDVGVLRYTDSAMAPYRNVFTTLYNSGRLIVDSSAPTNDPGHAAYCGSLLAATNGSIKGVAPGVTLYSTAGNGRTGGIEAAYEWLISQGVNIISRSAVNSTQNEYDYISAWFDHIAIQHDITTVQAAGNDGGTGVRGGGMSYNSITVGSSDDRNTLSRTDDNVSDFSSYINNYYSSLPMKPDLVAPGDGITTPVGVNSGTSLATPIVAGVVALLYQARPGLSANQALTKSILLSGIDDCGTMLMRTSAPGQKICAMWWDSGAGLLDAKAARYVAANNRYAGVTMGSNMTSYTKTFTVSASDTLTRVNLSWLKNNRLTGNHSTATPTDPQCAILYLEVEAPDGTIYKSERNGGNVQNICFIPPVAGTYTIRVKKISAPSSEPNVYFGLSWY